MSAMAEDTLRALARMQIGEACEDDAELVARAATGAPLRGTTHLRRKADPFAVLGATLGFLAIMAVCLLAYVSLSNAGKIEKATCAITAYAERQADAIRDPVPPQQPNLRAADELDKLGAQMRETGIGCPARRRATVTSSPTPR